jgi:hypothetical protein
MAKKQETGATPSSEGRFGSSEGWKTVGSENAFSRPNRNERDNSVFGRPNRTEDRYSGGGTWSKPTVAAPPPPNVESEADFPTLGGKKVEAKAVKPAGFSKLASSWAAQDAEERAAAAAAKADADRIAALEAKEAARYSNLFNRPIKNQVAYVSMADDYDDYDHSENYDDSWDSMPKGRNAMLDGGNEDNEGWSTK